MTDPATTMDELLDALASATTVDEKAELQQRAYALAYQALADEEGPSRLYPSAGRFDEVGLFEGSDWADPAHLQAGLVENTLETPEGVGIETCSQLRFLAIACGEVVNPRVTEDEARRFLEKVLALNLQSLFPPYPQYLSGADDDLRLRVQHLFAAIIDTLGADGIMSRLVGEAERILLTRPIKTERVRRMIETAAQGLEMWGASEVAREATLLVDAVVGPTPLARTLTDFDEYAASLEALDDPALLLEADTMSTSMRRTGLVSAHHSVLVRVAAARGRRMLCRALGIEDVGRCTLDAYQPLVLELIDRGVHPAIPQCVYGLAQLLDRGILFHPAVAPGLRTLLDLSIRPTVADELCVGVASPEPPPADAVLLAGTLAVLGLPRGVDQGHNPTCQSARAISLWAQNDPGFLLRLISQAARDGRIVMYFEGQGIDSSEVERGVADEIHTELDAVSLLLTPHLDRIYWEMSRRALDRREDEHKWVNPEFHGWWVHRGFAAIIDEDSGLVTNAEGFLRRFYAAYHPDYNGAREVMVPQPAGVATTNSRAVFLDWHAISLQRVGTDPQGELRVYFFNPNHDKGQDWGAGVVTSTSDRGELMGESSLPFHQFASRLYVFHYDPQETGQPEAVPDSEIQRALELLRSSWGRAFPWAEEQPPAQLRGEAR